MILTHRYHASRVNYCPGCGKSHWHVGRSSAECAFCGTALPLAEEHERPKLFTVCGIVRREWA